jgi:hypothetical protein
VATNPKKKEPKVARSNNKPVAKPEAKCLPIAAKGIETSQQLARYLSALMSDVVEGTVSPIVANAGTNAAGKLLKLVEMQHKYGVPNGKGTKLLALTESEDAGGAAAGDDPRTQEIADLEARLAELRQTR